MAKIKTLVEPFANQETICEEVLQAASAAFPQSSANAAEVIRDGAGKVVRIDVNVPDGDAVGLENARSAVASNSGVARASGFPLLVVNENYNQPDADLFSGVTNGVKHVYSTKFGAAEWHTVSNQLVLKPNSNDGTITVSASDAGLSGFTDYSAKCKFINANAIAAGAATSSVLMNLMSVIVRDGQTNWQYRYPGSAELDSGIALGTPLNVELTGYRSTGILLYKFNGGSQNSVSIPTGGTQGAVTVLLADPPTPDVIEYDDIEANILS